jgi:hypothetical protein
MFLIPRGSRCSPRAGWLRALKCRDPFVCLETDHGGRHSSLFVKPGAALPREDGEAFANGADVAVGGLPLRHTRLCDTATALLWRALEEEREESPAPAKHSVRGEADARSDAGRSLIRFLNILRG